MILAQSFSNLWKNTKQRPKDDNFDKPVMCGQISLSLICNVRHKFCFQTSFTSIPRITATFCFAIMRPTAWVILTMTVLKKYSLAKEEINCKK